MQQILFEVPFIGLPIYGFGAMLFLAFFLCTWWGIRRAKTIKLSSENIQDLAFVLFITGIIGARLFYVLQYHKQFQFNGVMGTIGEFIRIDRGGIVFYGCLIGGFIGFLGFRRIVLRRLGVSTWALADVIAPLLALGLAIGRIGCYLNGCCWGQVAIPECQPVPLAGPLAHFPLTSALAKDQLVMPGKKDGEPRPQCRAVQTSIGFVVAPQAPFGAGFNPRSVVSAVEPGSEAQLAGLQVGDRITSVNGKPNSILLVFNGPRELVERAVERSSQGGTSEGVKTVKDAGTFGCSRSEAEAGEWQAVVAFDDPAQATAAKARADELKREGPLQVHISDRFLHMAEEMPRGVTSFQLKVDRNGSASEVDFRPRTVTLFPTQIYEFISMILLIVLLLAYQPFRRHEGQLFVLWLICYGIHRFLNESIRIEPTYQLLGIDMGLTASQWISLGIILGGIILEIVLRKIQTPLPKTA
ncbi:MAG: prolipoprotein diacylglyceryl transferase family protein [Gemmataceae bacterium]